MWKLPLYQVDAFAERPFTGNPAAVCPLDRWLPDELMQAIAAENNLAETAFYVPEDDVYRLRWFTPATEVDLCGHATLATAYVLMNEQRPGLKQVAFETRSGRLTVTREGDLYSMDFPARMPLPCDVHPALIPALGGVTPVEVLGSRDYVVVYENEEQVRAIRPDMSALMSIDRFAVIVTAPGHSVDFVSRFFAPAQGVPEDPVTGSAHSSLIPYWAQRLGRNKLHARQISARTGDLRCEFRGERVTIAGRAVFYLKGEIQVPASLAAGQR